MTGSNLYLGTSDWGVILGGVTHDYDTGVAVICVSPGYVCPEHNYIPSDIIMFPLTVIGLGLGLG